MNYPCGKFDDFSFGRFGFIVRTDRITDGISSAWVKTLNECVRMIVVGRWRQAGTHQLAAGIHQIWRCQAMQCLEHKGVKLELDKASDGPQPVQFPQDGCDVVTSPCPVWSASPPHYVPYDTSCDLQLAERITLVCNSRKVVKRIQAHTQLWACIAPWFSSRLRRYTNYLLTYLYVCGMWRSG